MYSGTLGSIWKLAHNVQTKNIENLDLQKICEKLNLLITSQSKRLSIGKSVTLVTGVSKLYKQRLDKLFDDVKELDEDMIYLSKRKRLGSSCTPTESSDSMAESMDEVPEEMRQSPTVSFADPSFSPQKRRRTDPTIQVIPSITISSSPSDNLLGNVTNPNEEANNKHCSDDGNLDTEHVGRTAKSSSDENTENDTEEPISEENSDSQGRGEGVQPSPILTSRYRVNRGRRREN